LPTAPGARCCPSLAPTGSLHTAAPSPTLTPLGLFFTIERILKHTLAALPCQAWVGAVGFYSACGGITAVRVCGEAGIG
jgi:hypothetical protein